MENLTQGHHKGIFYQSQSVTFFQFLKKSRGEPVPFLSPSAAQQLEPSKLPPKDKQVSNRFWSAS